jgi:hypothetical protein
MLPPTGGDRDSRTDRAVPFATRRATKWSSSTSAVSGTNAISCRTASFCVSVDYQGFGFTYSGGAWSSGQRIGDDLGENDLLSISCPTISFCVGVGKDGYSFTYSEGKAS